MVEQNLLYLFVKKEILNWLSCKTFVIIIIIIIIITTLFKTISLKCILEYFLPSFQTFYFINMEGRFFLYSYSCIAFEKYPKHS